MKYNKISDVSHSLRELNRSINFKAGFNLRNDNALILHGRIVDVDGREIFSNRDTSDIAPEKYQNWDPRQEIGNLISTIDSEEFIEE